MIDKESPLPLTLERDGQPVGAALMSPKGYNKSLEKGVLWINVPGSNRILPMEGNLSFRSLEIRDYGYHASIASGSEVPVVSLELDKIDLEEHQNTAQSAREEAAPVVLERLEELIARRRVDMPEGSYTTHLFSKGPDKIKKKTGEEAIELVLAQKKEDIIYESADLIYHLMVLWQATDVRLQDVLNELQSREG